MHHSRSAASRGLLVYLCTIFLLYSCDTDVTFINNSSNGPNDYFEEPISERSKRFEQALHTSNQLVDYLIAEDFERFHARAVARMRQQHSVESIEQMAKSVQDALGPIVEYKPMQWAFTTRTENGVKVVYSTKIVVHEKGPVFYHFRFSANGPMRNYSMFHFSGQRGDERIGDAISRYFEIYDADA